MYCLAKANYEFFVYGLSSKVKPFIQGNLQTDWHLHFFTSENDLLLAVNKIPRKQNQKIVSLLY